MPHIAQVYDLDPEMMDGAPALIFRRLVVKVKAATPHREKNIPGACQFIIEENLGVHVPAPPLNARVNVGRKDVSMMEIERHSLRSFSSVICVDAASGRAYR